MRNERPWLVVGLAAFSIVGCTKRPAPVVTVNIDRALNATRSGTPPIPNIQVPPTLTGKVTTQFNATPPSTVLDRLKVGKIDPLAQVRAAQDEARTRLRNRLTRLYQAELVRFEHDLNAKAGTDRANLTAETNGKIQTALQELAQKRSRPMVRIALLAGYPDPNPKSIPPTNPPGPLAVRQFEETKEMRAQIAKADAEFAAQVKQILDVEQGKSVEFERVIKDQVESFRENLSKKAETEASAEIQGTFTDLGLKLTEVDPILFQGHPGATETFTPQATAGALPEVTSSLDRQSIANARKQVEDEVATWAAVSGYRIAAPHEAARDATEEFLKWRKGMKVGALGS